MKFVSNLNKNDYISFFNAQKDAHFLQSYEWGLTQKEGRGLIPSYVGLIDDDNNVVAVALLLKRKTPLNMCYFYAPRGFVIDYTNEKYFEEFTNGLKKYLKEENAIYLKVDPGIKYQDIDAMANPIKNGQNNYEIFNNFINLGYKHTGFYKLYEGNQPRYTVRINLHNDIDTINKNISKTFMKTVKRSYTYDLEIKMGDEVNTFYDLIQNNAHKDNFSAYNLEYYQAFFNNFKKYNHVKIFNAICYPDKIIKKVSEELKNLKNKLANNEINEKKVIDTNNQIKRLEKDLEIFKPYQNKYPDGKVVCSLICSYTNHAAWTLYIGNDSLGMHTFAVNRVYYEALLDAFKNHMDFYDLFGTVGDPKTTYKNLAGLHEFKRKFGGEYIEFIGEFDLINKPIWYKLLPKLLKIYRKLKASKISSKNHN